VQKITVLLFNFQFILFSAQLSLTHCAVFISCTLPAVTAPSSVVVVIRLLEPFRIEYSQIVHRSLNYVQESGRKWRRRARLGNSCTIDMICLECGGCSGVILIDQAPRLRLNRLGPNSAGKFMALGPDFWNW
jgi:hypothetical protein